MFKVKNGIASALLEESFQIMHPNHNLRNKREFKSHNVKTVFFGTESLSFLGSKIWIRFLFNPEIHYEFKQTLKIVCHKRL